MKVLITGARGQLGRALTEAARIRGHRVHALGRSELDISDPGSLSEAIVRTAPDWVFNCAAYTAVDAAEDNPAQATEVNATAVSHLSQQARERGFRILQPSTDYVFGHPASSPLTETDTPAPLNAYGRSKLEGERALDGDAGALVVRTSWLYDHRGGNFVTTIRRLAAERGELSVVDDQRGCPTYAPALSRVMLDLVEAGATGVWHASGSGDTTWHGFALAIVEELSRRDLPGGTARVLPISTATFGARAERPAYSVLSNAKLNRFLGEGLPPWRESLTRCIDASDA